MKKNHPHIFILGCCSAGMLSTVAHRLHKEGVRGVVVVNCLDTTGFTEELKNEPVYLKPFDDVLLDPTIYPQTKPIDAIASRHKYPRKKNEW